jgi:hypothetical protein
MKRRRDAGCHNTWQGGSDQAAFNRHAASCRKCNRTVNNQRLAAICSASHSARPPDRCPLAHPPHPAPSSTAPRPPIAPLDRPVDLGPRGNDHAARVAGGKGPGVLFDGQQVDPPLGWLVPGLGRGKSGRPTVRSPGQPAPAGRPAGRKDQARQGCVVKIDDQRMHRLAPSSARTGRSARERTISTPSA